MWGTSQRDVEVTQTILQQACVAFAAQSGKAVVVLSNRPKVEMEEFFMYVWICLCLHVVVWMWWCCMDVVVWRVNR